MTGLVAHSLHPVFQVGEMLNLAQNIASHGAFANPYSILPTGPTAENPPLYPLILAGLIRVLQVPSLFKGAIVIGSILANAVTAVLLPRIAFLFYKDVVPGFIASAFWIAAMPAFPAWDTSYTVAGLLFFCFFTSASIGGDRKMAQRAVLGGAIAGLLFLLNPSSLLVSLPWIGFLFWRSRSDLYRTAKYCGILLAALSTFYVGWCGRNYYQLGAFVPRTNLGMVLYVSNNDCAESTAFREVLTGCMQANHPFWSTKEAEFLVKLGEVQYDRRRIADAKNWARSNPDKFLDLTLTRILQFWIPAREANPVERGRSAYSYVVPDWVQSWVRQQNGVAYAIWVITLLSIPGLFLMVRNREPLTFYVLAVLAIYPLTYYVTVSDMRYRYPVLWLSLLAAGYFVSGMINLSDRSVRPKAT